MDIFSKARKVESQLARTLDRAFQQWSKPGPLEPLETLHAVVEAVEARLEPIGRGRYVFPFNKVKVSIAAASRDVRARFAAVLEGDEQLEQRITKRLRDAGCDATPLHVGVSYAARPGADWTRPDFHVEFDRVAGVEPPKVQEVTLPDLRVTVTNGSTEKPTYTFAVPRINIGRCAEVRDSRHRLIRTNHLAFIDGNDTTNETVSRRHAHIEYTAGAADYRITDDHSSHGT